MIELLNCDCMEYMATVPDKYFDLAIVDPPYGINQEAKMRHSQKPMEKHKRWFLKKNWDLTTPKNILT